MYRYKQLVKADDLRPDAVMEQVFETLNTLLIRSVHSSKRALHIRTFKVVPLAPEAGVLEWVSNTTPIGIYLIGDRKHKGAHARFHPKDWSSSVVSSKLMVLK